MSPAGVRVLALDVGGTKLATAIVRDDGTVDCFERGTADAHEGPEAMIARLLALARRTVAGGGPTPDVVGIGVGGPLDRLAGVVSPHNNPGWHDVPLGPIVTGELGLPVHLDNDANAGALGEWRFGAGRGFRNVVYLTLSTGVGGGAIVDGRLVRGATGNAAELGHTKVERGGRPCLCGSRGCLEAYASGPAISQRTAEAIGDGAASSLPPDGLTAGMVAAAAAEGDRAACLVWDETIEVLAVALDRSRTRSIPSGSSSAAA